MRRGRLFQPSNLEECESIGQELTVRDLVEWKGTTMDVTERAQARIESEKAFEEIKRWRDQPHDENVVLREQIDQAFMFEEIVVTSSAFQGVLSRRMKVAPTDSSVLVGGTSH
jgi:transcriptional regulator with GAF, ATPase, and Fis domain